MVVRRFTVKQYHAMIGKNGLKDGDPIELIDGMLVRKDRSRRGGDPMSHDSRHATGVSKLVQLDELIKPHRCFAQYQLPITIPDFDEPEPDGAVLKGSIEDYESRHPGPKDVLAVIEVADSSLKFDRTTKQRIYATAKIPVYWIVNVIDGQVEVYEQPQPAKGAYRPARVCAPGEMLTLKLTGQAKIEIAVDELLP